MTCARALAIGDALSMRSGLRVPAPDEGSAIFHIQCIDRIYIRYLVQDKQSRPPTEGQ